VVAGNNATMLFLEPHRSHHSSESFWSSLFALQLLEASRAGHRLAIPVFQYREEGDCWWFDRNGFLNVPNGLDFRRVVVEGSIQDDFVGNLAESIPKDLYGLKPDILIQLDRKVWIIEVKTIGSRIGGKKDLYERLCHFLQRNGYRAFLYFLISAGHEDKLDWELLRSPKTVQSTFKILLWEQFFKSVAEQVPDSLIQKCLGDLSEYYTPEDEYLQGKFA